MNSTLYNKIENIKKIYPNYKIKSLYTFGSVLTKNFDQKSDIDFIVSFQNVSLLEYADNYFEFCNNLKNILNKEVDVVVEKSIKNPFFKEEVNETKTLIYRAWKMDSINNKA